MLSPGMLASRAARMAERRRALWSGSPPPLRAATVTSRMSLVKRTPLVAPIASFLRLILVQRLWPDMPLRLSRRRARRPAHRAARPVGVGVRRDGLVTLQAHPFRTVRAA